MKKILIIFFVSFFVLFVFEAASLFRTGVPGHTRKNLNTKGDGCICHMADSTASVIVRINGPAVVQGNTSNIYRITMRGGPAITGGFDFNVYYGLVDTVPGQITQLWYDTAQGWNDVSHSWPQSFSADSASWLVKYVAPDTNVAMVDTLYATGNSTNNNGNPDDGDKWNFSPNFIVTVTPSIGIKKISTIAEEFSLSQNYPNPFNPVTRIRFSLPNPSRRVESSTKGGVQLAKLIVYDVLGHEIETLVNENLQPGTYEYDWDASHYASGVYYYQLITGSYSLVKKMILVK